VPSDRPVAPLVALLLAVSVGACALLPPLPRPGAAVVTMETHGGRCPAGECRSVVRVLPDGTIERQPRADPVFATFVEPASWRAIQASIEATDWDEVRSHAFVGECPTAFDSSEQIWTFATSNGDVVIASCTVAIDEQSEPFRTLGGALFGAGG
jgi:hypothetical protein